MIVALDLLEQAICHDPNYGSALALAASCHLNLHVGAGPTIQKKAAGCERGSG